MAGSLKQKRLESQKRTAIEEGAVLPSEEKVDVASSYKQVVFFGAGPVWTTRRYNKPVAVQIKIKVEDAVSADTAPWIVLFNMNFFNNSNARRQIDGYTPVSYTHLTLPTKVNV